MASTGPPARQRERNIYVTLGSGTYVVMCAAFMAGMEGSFKVRYRECADIREPMNEHNMAVGCASRTLRIRIYAA